MRSRYYPILATALVPTAARLSYQQAVRFFGPHPLLSRRCSSRTPWNTSGGGALFPESSCDPNHRTDWELTFRPIILPCCTLPGSPKSTVRPPPAMAIRGSWIRAHGTWVHSQSWHSNGQITAQNGSQFPLRKFPQLQSPQSAKIGKPAGWIGCASHSTMAGHRSCDTVTEHCLDSSTWSPSLCYSD